MCDSGWWQGPEQMAAPAGPGDDALSLGAVSGLGGAGAGAVRVLDVTAVSALLRRACADLGRGLQRSGEAPAVAEVIDAHRGGHADWVELIGWVRRRLGPEAAGQLTDLYAEHGRLVATLELGMHRFLEPDIAQRAHRLLAERLHDATEAAIAVLAGARTPRR